ncbi:MAG: 2-C-methyl-D-erythritol 4-phosphate cytidylyltransferase [Oscillospiraceae bacterium]
MFNFKKKKNKDVSVIILAAGNSERMGVDKQFLTIYDKPLLWYSIDAFCGIECISEIIVVTKSESIKKVQDMIITYNLSSVKTIVVGGNTRQESAYKGFLEIDKKNSNIIMLHDGARPFIYEEEILDLIENTRKYGASCLGVMAKDTIKEIDESGFVMKTLNRDKLIQTQTPQSFSIDIYEKALELNKTKANICTDDASLVELSGIKVYVTKGNYENIKITTESDINIAESIVNKKTYKRGKI